MQDRLGHGDVVSGDKGVVRWRDESDIRQRRVDLARNTSGFIDQDAVRCDTDAAGHADKYVFDPAQVHGSRRITGIDEAISQRL